MRRADLPGDLRRGRRAGARPGAGRVRATRPWSRSTPTPARRCAATGASGRSSRATWPTWTGAPSPALTCSPAACPARRSPSPGSSSAATTSGTCSRRRCAWSRRSGPRAVLLENVRGLAARRFDGYRTQVLERLQALGYQTWWDLVHASEHGVPQLRPRFVLVAIRQPWAAWFRWPEPLRRAAADGRRDAADLMGSRGWPGADGWRGRARGHRADDRRRQQEARRPGPGPDPGPRGLEASWASTGSASPTRRPGPLPGRPAAQADRPDGGPAAGLPRRLGVHRPQDGRLPAGRQRVPAAGGQGARHRDPRRADHGSAAPGRPTSATTPASPLADPPPPAAAALATSEPDHPRLRRNCRLFFKYRSADRCLGVQLA